MPKLFSYGTLQQENVQLETFGRELNGHLAILTGYIVGEVQITDSDVIATSGSDRHPILRYTGNPDDQVQGTVFDISDGELAQADDYEVDAYVRIEATLASGEVCWIYAAADEQHRPTS